MQIQKLYLYGEGIVLIDEIELHLHPKWQREVINKLQKFSQ
ncbi:MAG: AAA family ATPase [Moraxella osloensis]